jgi:alkaline phosphatase D
MRDCCRPLLSLPLLRRELTHGVLKPLLVVVLVLWACAAGCTEAVPVTTNAYASQPLSRIAFGSCNKADKPQPLWQAILQSAPQLWIWTGDII